MILSVRYNSDPSRPVMHVIRYQYAEAVLRYLYRSPLVHSLTVYVRPYLPAQEQPA